MRFATSGPRPSGGTQEWVGAGRRLVALGLLAHLTLPVVAEGQTPRWEVDLSGSRIELDTAQALNAPAIATLVEWQRPSMFARLAGSLTGLENSGWSTQGRGDLAGWLSPLGLINPFRFELAGTLVGSRHSSGFDAFLARGDARLHLRSQDFGVWGGAGLATARNSFDAAAVTGIVPNVGVWVQDGSLRATLTYLHTRVSGYTYPEVDFSVVSSRGPIDAHRRS